MSKFLPRDTSGLSEVRLRPQEEASSPLSLFTVPIPDKLITGCTEAVFQPFNSLKNYNLMQKSKFELGTRTFSAIFERKY